MLTEGDHDKMRGFAPEPTERMTDERLAEIERHFAAGFPEWDTGDTAPYFDEVWQALKAERAEVARLTAEVKEGAKWIDRWHRNAEAAEAKLTNLESQWNDILAVQRRLKALNAKAWGKEGE